MKYLMFFFRQNWFEAAMLLHRNSFFDLDFAAVHENIKLPGLERTIQVPVVKGNFLKLSNKVRDFIAENVSLYTNYFSSKFIKK